MKGLLVKDYYLLFQRKQAIVIFVLLSVFMGYAMDGTFIIGYLTILGAIFAIGTISYDDADNGLMFIMTLPVGRKQYAQEKYIFCFAVCLGMLVLSFVILLLMSVVKSEPVLMEDAAATAASTVPVALLVLDVLIPIQLKFGAEKSRIALIIIAAAVFASVTLVSKNVVGRVDIDGVASRVGSLPAPVFIVAAIVLVAAATAISVRISTKVMEKKSF